MSDLPALSEHEASERTPEPSRRSWLPHVLAFVVLTACASGPRLILGQPIKKEVAVQLRVVNDAHGDQFGGIAAMTETVTDGLTQRGIPNQLYAADEDHPGTPRIEILVTQWGEGDAVLRATGGVVGGVVGAMIHGAGEGDFEVLVSIYREGDVKPACVHKHAGKVDPDDAGGTVGVGTSIGSSILIEALRPTADCSSLPPAGKNYSVR